MTAWWRYCLAILMAFALADSAVAQLPLDEIRARALDALESNSKQIRDILWERQVWSEFSGIGGSLFDSHEVQTKTPILRLHLEMVNDKPMTVLDGWEDQPPLAFRYSIQKRINLGRGVISNSDITREFLSGNRRFVLLGIKTDRDRRAYVILSKPSEALPRDAQGIASCAAAMNATLTIDLSTLFPIRVDAQVMTPQKCLGEVFATTEVGAKLQYHYVRVRGKSRCGNVHEIYAINQTVHTGTLNTDGVIMAPGSVAERPFLPGQNYRRGTFKQMEVNNNFRIFLTGGCVTSYGTHPDAMPDAAKTASLSEPPVDFFEVESYFNLEGVPLELHDGRKAESATVLPERSVQMASRTALPPAENPAPSVPSPAKSSLRRALRSATPRGNRDPGDFWGTWGDWSWQAKGIDARGFEGTRFGVGGDYFLPSTLNLAVLENGRELYQRATAFTVSTTGYLERELLRKRVFEAFGDGTLSPERLASVLMAVSVIPDTQSGVVVFHWKYEWNYARILAPAQREFAQKFWRANFLADSPLPSTPRGGALAGNLNSKRRDEITEALRDGCVDPDVAASAFLSYALGDNKVAFGQVEFELSKVTPGMIFFHLSADRSIADKLAHTIFEKIGTIAYTDVDENNNVIGSSLYGEGRPFGNYVKSYYHGELCGH